MKFFSALYYKSSFKMLLIGAALGGILLGVRSLSAYLPHLGNYILTYQLENLGFTVHQIGCSAVGWREAHFKNIIVSPSFLEPVETLLALSDNKKLTQYVLVKNIDIHYTPKDLLLRRFRDIYVETVRGVLSLGSDSPYDPDTCLTTAQKLTKTTADTENYTDLSTKRSNKIDIKDAQFFVVTPVGALQVNLEVSLTDFFSRKVLGSGRIMLQGRPGSIDGMVKIDKIEHRLWRLTMDISNGIIEMPFIVGSDVNSHLEILIAPRNKYVNGHIHFSHLTLPTYFKNTFTGFETDFKYTLDDHQSLKGDVLMKIPQLRLYDVKGHNGHCRLHFGGNFERPFDRLKGNFGFDEVEIINHLKPVHLKGFIRLNDQQLEVEGTVNRTPLALNFLVKHHLSEKVGTLTMTALSPLIFKIGGLTLSYFSPKLSDYLDKFEGMVFLKCEDQWNKDKPNFSPIFTIDGKDVSFYLHDVKIKNMNTRFVFDHFFNQGTIDSLTIEKLVLPKTTLNNVAIQGKFDVPLLKVTSFDAVQGDHSFKAQDFDLNLTKKIAEYIGLKIKIK